jgi:hypothetical protein
MIEVKPAERMRQARFVNRRPHRTIFAGCRDIAATVVGGREAVVSIKSWRNNGKLSSRRLWRPCPTLRDPMSMNVIFGSDGRQHQGGRRPHRQTQGRAVDIKAANVADFENTACSYMQRAHCPFGPRRNQSNRNLVFTRMLLHFECTLLE